MRHPQTGEREVVPVWPAHPDPARDVCVRRIGGHGIDVGDQMRHAGRADFGEMNLVADPFRRAFDSVAGFRVIG